jgi:hypothetical protein
LICTRRPRPDFISSSCFTPDSDLVFISVAWPKSHFCPRFSSPGFCFDLRLGPHCGRRRPDFISISIPLKGFHFPLFIFRCHRHQLCWISAQHLVFRRAGSLLRVFLSVARCSEGAALTWIFALSVFPSRSAARPSTRQGALTPFFHSWLWSIHHALRDLVLSPAAFSAVILRLDF